MARKFQKTLVIAIASLVIYSLLSLCLENYYVLDNNEELALFFDKHEIVAFRGDKGAAHRGSSSSGSHHDELVYKSELGACLDLVDNDNNNNSVATEELLTEWLAYHYTILPLRSLIVAVDDQKGITAKLLPVLSRWRRDTRLEIIVWEAEDFLHGRDILRRRKRSLDALLNNNTSDFKLKVEEDLRHERRDAFLSQCFLHHSLKGTRWVVASLEFTDFVVPGTVLFEESSPLLDNDASGLVHQLGSSRENDSCITFPVAPLSQMPQYNNFRTNDTQENFLLDLNLRTRKRYFEGGAESVPDTLFWMIVDVFRVGLEGVPPKKTVETYHRFLSRFCGRTSSNDSSESSMNRAFRLLPQSEGRSGEQQNGVLYFKGWINDFMNQVGAQRAQHLLRPRPRGPGGISNETLEEPDSQSCALLFFGLARQFEGVVYPSIKRYILDENASCDVYVHTYNVTKAEGGGNRGKFVKGEDGSGIVHPEEVLLLFDEERRDGSRILFETEKEFRAQRDFKAYRKFFPVPSTWDYPHSMDNMIRQWHSIDKVWALMAWHERTHRHRRYRRVGLFRLDLVYTHPIRIIPEAREKELAVIPSIMYLQTTWFGYNDRMFYGTRTYAEIWATDRFGSVKGYLRWQKRHTTTKNETKKNQQQPKGLHSENFLRFLLTQKWRIPLTIKDICFQRVRSNGVVLIDDCLFLESFFDFYDKLYPIMGNETIIFANETNWTDSFLVQNSGVYQNQTQ